MKQIFQNDRKTKRQKAGQKCVDYLLFFDSSVNQPNFDKIKIVLIYSFTTSKRGLIRQIPLMHLASYKEAVDAFIFISITDGNSKQVGYRNHF